jgi:hypothetical protein
MIDRRYTVREIDDLRRVLDLRWLYGSSIVPLRRFPRSLALTYKESERSAAVEDLVRTHILCGHTAADIEAADAA